MKTEFLNYTREGFRLEGGRQSRCIVVMPYINQAQAECAAHILETRANFEDALLLCVNDQDRHGFIEICNSIFAATDSDYFGYLASDVFPSRHWLAMAINLLDKSPNRGLLAFNDGKWFGRLASFGLVRRLWVERIYSDKHMFHHGYQSHYADTELSVVAWAQSQAIYDPNIGMFEVDYEKETKGTNLSDKNLYAIRIEALKKLDTWISREPLKWFS